MSEQQEPTKISFAQLAIAIKGKPHQEQEAICRQVGYEEKEIGDFLNWVNTPAKKPEKVVDLTPFTATPTFEAIQNRIQENMEKARQNPPQREPELSPFERDKLVIRYLLGGSCERLGDASLHNPNLKDTAVIRWLRDEFHRSRLSNALLLGDTGCGKTWGALAYAVSLMHADIRAGVVQHCHGMFVTAYQLSEMVMAPSYYRAQLDRSLRVPVLILDDLGAEPQKGYKESDFKQYFTHLFTQRHKFGRSTIITTNEEPGKLAGLYGDRFVSRFRETGLDFESKDLDMRVREEVK